MQLRERHARGQAVPGAAGNLELVRHDAPFLDDANEVDETVGVRRRLRARGEPIPGYGDAAVERDGRMEVNVRDAL